MPQTVNVHEAKTHLSKLLARVEAGEEIVIARGGKPIARLVPESRSRKHLFGTLRGKIVVADDFDEPMPEAWLADFYGPAEPDMQGAEQSA